MYSFGLQNMEQGQISIDRRLRKTQAAILRHERRDFFPEDLRGDVQSLSAWIFQTGETFDIDVDSKRSILFL
uniref:Uncharacterized protein n=1 Tax=Physcomitrium patens TaxID=3218 RepID=A0A2K1J0C5_PHYPA|nr:hypothetical protein PHYPA_022881 [Physcomitrium patens]